MTLIEVGTHAVIDAVFGTDSEQVLASRLAPALTARMSGWPWDRQITGPFVVGHPSR